MAKIEILISDEEAGFHPDNVKVEVVDLFAQQELLRNRAGDFTTQVRLTVPDPSDPYSPDRDQVVLVFENAADASAVLGRALEQVVPMASAQAAEPPKGAA